jgi:hypothetical protein
MADTIPYIVMAFASPSKDLQFMEVEELQLTRKFNNIKAQKGDFDFFSIREATGQDIIESFTALRNRKPCVFHYSGHSDGVVLNWQDKETPSLFELSKILDNDYIKIVFLNGCSTKGFVEGILEKTKVKAVIATRLPVNDEIAKEISLAFYTHFIIERYSLQESFDNLLKRTKFTQACVDVKGSNTREIGWD